MIDEVNKTIAIVWSVEDVLMLAEDDEVTLSEKEAWEILKRAYHQHDCNYGLTWEHISATMNDYLTEQREAP